MGKQPDPYEISSAAWYCFPRPRYPEKYVEQEVKTLPNIKSAKKRVLVSEKKNLRNRMVKSAVRTSVKKFDAAVAADPTTANVQLTATTSAIDKAVAKGVIHKNAANRKKARLAKQLNKAAAI